MISKFAILFGALLVVQTLAQQTFMPGVKSAMDISVIQQGKDTYFDSVMKLVNNIKIPDIYTPDGKGYFKSNSFVYTERDDMVKFSPDILNNAMVLTCRRVSAMLYSNDF